MTQNDKRKIDYQFVPGPINLMWALDNDCWKAICILIDKENYWKSRSKVFNGYFTLSVEELAEHLRLKNKKDARLTLEAMYRAGIIDVKAESGKRLGAKIKINWDKITSEDIDWVEKLPRDAKITYCEDANCTETSTNCTPTLEKEIDIEKEKDIEKIIDKDIREKDLRNIKNDDFVSSLIIKDDNDYYDSSISNNQSKNTSIEDISFITNGLSNEYDESMAFIREFERRNKQYE